MVTVADGSDQRIADALAGIAAHLEHLAQALRGQAVTRSERLSYRVPAAAKLVGVSERTMAELVRTGRVRSTLVGTARLIPRSALLELLGAEDGDD